MIVKCSDIIKGRYVQPSQGNKNNVCRSFTGTAVQSATDPAVIGWAIFYHCKYLLKNNPHV